MDLQYYGGNCVVLSNKNVRLAVDDNLVELGHKPVTKPEDVALFTGVHGVSPAAPRLTFDGPGEYEVSGLSIVGIAARANIDPPSTRATTMFKVITDDANYLITGHIYPDLDDDQLEAIGTIDVLIVPVGGNGYTLDPTGALQIIKKIEPKLVVPTHYAEPGINYPIEQQSLDAALRTMAMEPRETVSRLHFKRGEAADTTQLVVISR